MKLFFVKQRFAIKFSAKFSTKFFLALAGLLLTYNVTALGQFIGGPGLPESPQIGITFVDPVAVDEVVAIENPTRFPMDFTGWTLVLTRASSRLVSTYAFPDGCFLPSGGAIRVHSGPANVGVANTECGGAEADLVWTTSFALPNDAFTLKLINPGGEVVSQYDYPLPLLPPVFVNEMEISSASGAEWVELYNAGGEAVDLTGWTLNIQRGTSVKLSIPIDQIIPAGGYVVISVPIPFLNDSGEIVELRDEQERLVSTTPETGLPDDLTDERCWARVPDGAVTWAFQPCTRGASNASGQS